MNEYTGFRKKIFVVKLRHFTFEILAPKFRRFRKNHSFFCS
jgi:hypothetical protein